MGRDVPYCEDEVCDICGKAGAFDFMGDCICYECLEKDKVNQGSERVKIEKQVVSLELAKELKENGYPQEGVWFYNSETMKLQKGFTSHTTADGKMKWSIVAPTVAELGEMLPTLLEVKKEGLHILKFYKHNNAWRVSYESDRGLSSLCEAVKANTEANARAKMWLYLRNQGVL